MSVHITITNNGIDILQVADEGCPSFVFISEIYTSAFHMRTLHILLIQHFFRYLKFPFVSLGTIAPKVRVV